MRVGILNVTGYAGAELARLLRSHPDAELVSVTGRSGAGKPLASVFPHLGELELEVAEHLPDGLDLVFSALPHRASAVAAAPLVNSGVRVVDVSADFRLRDPAVYEAWYGERHPHTELLEEAVYGLTELHRQDVSRAALVANPGCYAACAILALAPAVKAGITTGDVVIDGKSGASGAGRGLALGTHFSEVNESVSAYSVDGHRHLPEIEQELGALSPSELRTTFLPHLVPMTRGILATCYAPLRPGSVASRDGGSREVAALYRDFYAGEPFVRVVEEPPATKHTLGNNLCLVHPTVDRRAERLVAIACLDNLVKGAAGQAVQNMNVMHGLPEGAGLGALALYP